MQLPIILLIVLFAIVVVVAGIFGWLSEKKRLEALALWARQQGLRHHPGKDKEFRQRLSAFDCFQTGHSRYAQNVCDGERHGRPVAAFDYHYATTSHTGKTTSTTHHNFSAVLIETGLPLKPLTVRAENMFDRFGAMVGLDDIDFESTEFSDRFHVKSPDRRWAHDVLHQATMEFLLESPVFTVEMAGPWILARRSTRLDPSEFSDAIALLEGILERLPRYLLRDLTGVDA